jgi:hypothetical protein
MDKALVRPRLTLFKRYLAGVTVAQFAGCVKHQGKASDVEKQTAHLCDNRIEVKEAPWGHVLAKGIVDEQDISIIINRTRKGCRGGKCVFGLGSGFSRGMVDGRNDIFASGYKVNLKSFVSYRSGVFHASLILPGGGVQLTSIS